MAEKPVHLTNSNYIIKYVADSCNARINFHYIAKINPNFSFLNNVLYSKDSFNDSSKEITQVLTNKLKSSIYIVKIYTTLVQLLIALNNENDNLINTVAKLQFEDLNFNKAFNQSDSINNLSQEIVNLIDCITEKDNSAITEDTLSTLKDYSNLSTSTIIDMLENLHTSYQNSLIYLLLDSGKTEEIRISLLGKNGVLTEAAKSLAALSSEERKLKGSILNNIKNQATTIIALAKKEVLEQELQQKLLQESIDVTLPIYDIKSGGLHPLTKVLEEVVTIFSNLGFKVAEGPEIEDEWYNFSALNFSEFHPAKDSHDTFYFSGNEGNQDNKKLLRTHTSNVQIREMQKGKLPLQIIAPGKVYRSDDDATHTPMFHQIEGLYVNKTASVAELKHILTVFCEKFFEVKNIPLRFRPSYFPFTSPSLEVDIGCKFSKEGVIIGGGTDWLEILGCGMVHPNVLKNCNVNPKEYKGFAFGMGLERIAMLKYGFPDLREFFSSNYLWLKAYNFNVIKALLQLNS